MTTSDYVINSSDSHCCFSDLCVPYRGSSSTSFLRSEIQLLLSLPSLHPSSFAGDPLHLMPEHRPQLTSSPLLDPEGLSQNPLFLMLCSRFPRPLLQIRIITLSSKPELHPDRAFSRQPSLSLRRVMCFTSVCLAGEPDDSGELNVSTYGLALLLRRQNSFRLR
ncbi:unnamed protein product [Brassica napus]|uniref:(rape) hypothetical protein n=1 Tax=Brassica napus TaxID=3708 RepID=A0A816VKF1_BRANA|nr:unnamed protein product [Brassica napus]